MHDLAARLGITVPAAKSRLLRARAELRQRMLRHCPRTGPWTLMTRVAAPPERVFHQQAHRHPVEYGNRRYRREQLSGDGWPEWRTIGGQRTDVFSRFTETAERFLNGQRFLGDRI